ncbi:unnamed protein product [Rotaria magnacalcarata]|uniref:RBR-type E3 ubiquitin transferase n=1 Tax=Rotaria magnacalcarata TaxID=392030 RepID=A0A815PXT2_9BILA|nr:unnamed protein product [Rotaria magnacalcarata]
MMATKATRSEGKLCGLCNTLINEYQYRAHVAKCGVSSGDDNDNKAETVLKVCSLCERQVKDLADHYRTCTGVTTTTNRNHEYQQKSRNTPIYEHPSVSVSNASKAKECIICSEMIAENVYANHVDRCISNSSIRSKQLTKTKECVICSEMIAENIYANHVNRCTSNLSMRSKNLKGTKECIICSKMIPEDDHAHHINKCLAQSSMKQTKQKTTKECIICFQEIAESDYAAHVDACISRSSSSTKPKPISRKSEVSCFTCSSPVSSSKTSSHTVPCRSHHIYCLKCLQNSMNEYIQSNTAPVCHSTLCDYEFSRYDVACIPLEADTIKRLSNCVKITRRPQCPICSFYIDFNTMDDFQKHVASCNLENFIPCEYCHCPYNVHRLNDHSQQCRSAPRSQQLQALIDFILPRTKYLATAQQIRVFIAHRKKTRAAIEPHAIIDALAELDGAFPFDIPTLDCGICMETCIYDDIFVFGCEENHKLCYVCFENSCASKMNNNETLTCGMCNYQLQEGEIKQLRVPADRKRQYLDYQIQKTFSAYVGGSQGIIRCPNGSCKWVAEASNPNDRFQVKCPMCGYEFCSLCNRQYHFRTTCQQIPEITERWFFWCDTERGRYWQARAQQDAQFRTQLDDYERQKAANIQRNQELAERYNELLADEQYKSANCRLCPHCQRVVQHLGGCDLMVCGQNYHGGDEQSGCGKGFRFSQALPYVSATNGGPQQVSNHVPEPEQQKLVVHHDIQCDTCHDQVQGIRFDCVHCASLIFCEKCEQRSTLEHSNEIRNQKKQQHVFQLITQSLNQNDS